VYPSRENDTPAKIFHRLDGVDLDSFLSTNRELYDKLAPNTKLKKNTYLLCDTGRDWTEGTVISDRQYLEDKSLWRMHYDGTPREVLFDMTWNQVRDATWAYQVEDEGWETELSAANPYIGSRCRRPGGAMGTVVGCYQEDEVDDATGKRQWKVHHDDYDGRWKSMRSPQFTAPY
jgi:hypothetical protein